MTTMLINLIGEQPAPNLLPVYELRPDKTLLVATERTKSVAERLAQHLREKGYPTEIMLGEAYDIETTIHSIQQALKAEKATRLVGNFTGGTKVMVLALLRVFQQWPYDDKQLVYFRTEGSQGVLYFFDPDSLSDREVRPLKKTLTLEDYLQIYLGDYRFEGPGPGPGHTFEVAVAEALSPVVDELYQGLRKGGALDIDLVFRCGNQIGIAEVKSGGKARSKEGIDQLNTAGGRDFLGTYVKKFLIVDTSWEELTNLKELAAARNIVLIELPSFGQTGSLDLTDKQKLENIVNSKLLCGELTHAHPQLRPPPDRRTPGAN